MAVSSIIHDLPGTRYDIIPKQKKMYLVPRNNFSFQATSEHYKAQTKRMYDIVSCFVLLDHVLRASQHPCKYALISNILDSTSPGISQHDCVRTCIFHDSRLLL